MQYRPEQKSLFENVFLQKFSQKNTKICFFSFRAFNVHEVISMQKMMEHLSRQTYSLNLLNLRQTLMKTVAKRTEAEHLQI